MTTIAEVQAAAWDNSEEKGFHSAHYSMPGWQSSAFVKLALITTEVAEATEELRKAKSISDLGLVTSGWGWELADIFIRLADLAEDTGIDLGAAVESKMEVNKARPHLHGGKTA